MVNVRFLFWFRTGGKPRHGKLQDYFRDVREHKRMTEILIETRTALRRLLETYEGTPYFMDETRPACCKQFPEPSQQHKQFMNLTFVINDLTPKMQKLRDNITSFRLRNEEQENAIEICLPRAAINGLWGDTLTQHGLALLDWDLLPLDFMFRSEKTSLNRTLFNICVKHHYAIKSDPKLHNTAPFLVEIV